MAGDLFDAHLPIVGYTESVRLAGRRLLMDSCGSECAKLYRGVILTTS